MKQKSSEPEINERTETWSIDIRFTDDEQQDRKEGHNDQDRIGRWMVNPIDPLLNLLNPAPERKDHCKDKDGPEFRMKPDVVDPPGEWEHFEKVNKG